MEPERQIYFVWLRFDREMYARGIGFTTSYGVFARGADSDEAKQRAADHYAKKYNVGVEARTASLARQQDSTKYAFPEQIV